MQSEVPQAQLNSVEKAVLRTVGIQHPHLHLPWAAFEDAGLLCIMYPPVIKAGMSATIYCSHTAAPSCDWLCCTVVKLCCVAIATVEGMLHISVTS